MSVKNLDTFDPLTLRKVWKWLCICEKEANIGYRL